MKLIIETDNNCFGALESSRTTTGKNDRFVGLNM